MKVCPKIETTIKFGGSDMKGELEEYGEIWEELEEKRGKYRGRDESEEEEEEKSKEEREKTEKEEEKEEIEDSPIRYIEVEVAGSFKIIARDDYMSLHEIVSIVKDLYRTITNEKRNVEMKEIR